MENLLLNKNLFERRHVPVILQLTQTNIQLGFQHLTGMIDITAQNLTHPYEMRLVIHNDTSVRRD